SFQEAGVIQQAYNLNFLFHVVPTRCAQRPAWSAFSVSSPAIVLETGKQAGAGARDRPEAVVVRLHKACGSTVTAWLQTSLPVKKAMLRVHAEGLGVRGNGGQSLQPCALTPSCDLLEHLAAQGCLPLEQQGLRLSFTPFRMLSVLLLPSH
ncbi:MA2C1 mannosidase, partial [Aegithalos caudatus]|nr:MA2C1 mannosidase [Aegithalos caudatus]